jgi:hypothetical protein
MGVVDVCLPWPEGGGLMGAVHLGETSTRSETATCNQQANKLATYAQQRNTAWQHIIQLRCMVMLCSVVVR